MSETSLFQIRRFLIAKPATYEKINKSGKSFKTCRLLGFHMQIYHLKTLSIVGFWSDLFMNGSVKTQSVAAEAASRKGVY